LRTPGSFGARIGASGISSRHTAFRRVVHRRIRLELAPGQVKRAHYCGEELVIFRAESAGNVLDAYCLATSPGQHGGRGPSRGEQTSARGTAGMERRRHQRPDPVSKNRLQAERPLKTYPVGVVRLLMCGTNATAAPRTGGAGARPNSRPRSIPAAPAYADGERVKVHAEDASEPAASLSRAICATKRPTRPKHACSRSSGYTARHG